MLRCSYTNSHTTQILDRTQTTRCIALGRIFALCFCPPCFEMCFLVVFLFEHQRGDSREAFVCWTTAEPTTLPGNLGFYHAATVHEDKSSKILPRSVVKGSYPSLSLVHFLICNIPGFQKDLISSCKACLFPPKSQSPPSGRPMQPLSQAIVLTKLAISTEVDEK